MQTQTSQMEPQPGRIDPDVLRRLHASSIAEKSRILALLGSAHESRLNLVGRRTVRGDAESARIVRITSDALLLECQHVSIEAGTNFFLTFALDGRSYFFAVATLGKSEGLLRAEIPRVVYVAERRDRQRMPVGADQIPRHVVLSGTSSDWESECDVRDYSPVGLYVEASEDRSSRVGAQVRVKYLDGTLRGTESWGLIRHARPAERRGWVRLGVSTSEVPFSNPIRVERRRAVSAATPMARARNSLSFMSAGIATASSRLLRRVRSASSSQADFDVVEYSNGNSEKLVGILDRSNDALGGTAVVIPPAWGRTKETLLPLAATIVETFRRSGESVSVLRFDGTRRRGESHKEVGFSTPGLEHVPFRLSHAVSDILASSRFLRECPAVRASRVILITFSAASIEGRRALVEDCRQTISGWVSVVGSPDLQSGMRTVSGGIDYVAGVEQGLSFGRQEIMGVDTDVDGLIGEAVDQRLAFLEDARRDMAQLSVPVTWIHGANDAWLDLERVREVVGSGDVSNRKLIEVPTGHQLRSSREALDVFMLVSEQCVSMALGRSLPGALPRLVELESRRRAERARLAAAKQDIRGFWRTYLLGRGEMLGIELMNATGAYESLMASQLADLRLTPGCVLADVGAGTGSLLFALLDAASRPEGLVVDEIDYVPEALERARSRLAGLDLGGVAVRFIECDLEDRAERLRTFGTERYDAVLLSLVLSYVREPLEVLRAIAAGMKPGGRLVASTLQQDADISRLYLESVDELRAGRARELLGGHAEKVLDESVRTFLNDMARILDLEEQGVFRFLDAEAFVNLVEDAGFEDIESYGALGDPPQAVVVRARKPLE